MFTYRVEFRPPADAGRLWLGGRFAPAAAVHHDRVGGAQTPLEFLVVVVIGVVVGRQRPLGRD